MTTTFYDGVLEGFLAFAFLIFLAEKASLGRFLSFLGMLVRRLLTIIIIITPGLVNIFLLAGLIDTITCTAAHAIHNLYYMFNLHIFLFFLFFYHLMVCFYFGGEGGSQPAERGI